MPAILIFVGPSAIGKSFAASMLSGMFPDHFARVRVYTTRRKRGSEQHTSDRVFLSAEEFEQMARCGEFSINERFAGNQYGIRKDDLKLTDHYLIADAPPQWLPQFLPYEDAVFIGLQACHDYWTLLDARMKARGDSREIRSTRKSRIETDIQDLERLSPFVNRYGKVFQVKDDRTVPDIVVPWIIKRLGLPRPA